MLALGLLLGLAACRTPPFELTFDGGRDAAGHPSGPDLSVPLPPDLLPPPDLAIPPDFTPPPDLAPPHYCDGIFVFQEDGRLAFFDPKQFQFHDLFRLNCPARGAGPFSMAVDRVGIAWVEYDNGQLFQVDTSTGACAATPFVDGQAGFTTFGMGFAADGPGSPNETLYLANSTIQNMGASNLLGSLELVNYKITPIGTLPDNAELTGNGAGELWAFFASQNPHYGRVDKQTAAVMPDIPVPQLGDTSQDAFAFGTYAGLFYAFLSPQRGSTSVYQLDPKNGTSMQVVANSGRVVVGAGVSTCAPGQ